MLGLRLQGPTWAPRDSPADPLLRVRGEGSDLLPPAPTSTHAPGQHPRRAQLQRLGMRFLQREAEHPQQPHSSGTPKSPQETCERCGALGALLSWRIKGVRMLRPSPGQAHAAAAASRDTGCSRTAGGCSAVSHGGGTEGSRLQVCAAHLLLGLAERQGKNQTGAPAGSDGVCPFHVLLVSC